MRHKRDWARETVLRCHSNSGRTGVSCENTRRRDSAERDSESRHSYYPVCCGLLWDASNIEPARVKERIQTIINSHSLRIPGRTLEEDTRTSSTVHGCKTNSKQGKVTRGRTPRQRGKSIMDNTRTIISITPGPYIVNTVRSLKRRAQSRARSNSSRIQDILSRRTQTHIDVDTRNRADIRHVNLEIDSGTISHRRIDSRLDREGGRGNSMSLRDGRRHRQKREGQSTQEY